MRKTASSIILFSGIALLTACQSTSQQYNGRTGFQVEQRTATTATLTYTLASVHNINAEMRKLQSACQQTLGSNKTYEIKLLDVQEIAAPVAPDLSENSIALNERTSFGFSNTPEPSNNTEAYSARQIEEVRPTVLKIVRYSCS